MQDSLSPGVAQAGLKAVSILTWALDIGCVFSALRGDSGTACRDAKLPSSFICSLSEPLLPSSLPVTSSDQTPTTPYGKSLYDIKTIVGTVC